MKVGDKVRAFHPRMLGVVKEGRVVAANKVSARIDFGILLGGTLSVPIRDVLPKVDVHAAPIGRGFRKGL